MRAFLWLPRLDVWSALCSRSHWERCNTSKQWNLCKGLYGGIIALPAGLVLGALYPENCTGYTAEKLVARDGALCHPQPCAALCTARLRPSAWLVWSGVRWLGVLLFCWMTWACFVPERSVMPPDVVEEVLVIILKITIIVCGSLVAGRLVLAKCRWLEWAASGLGVNEYAVLGLLTKPCLRCFHAAAVSPDGCQRENDKRCVYGIGAFVLGGQMAFAAGVADGRAVAAYFCNKAGRRFIGFDIGVLLCEKYGSSIHNRYIRNAGSKIIQELTFAGGCAEKIQKIFRILFFSRRLYHKIC